MLVPLLVRPFANSFLTLPEITQLVALGTTSIISISLSKIEKFGPRLDAPQLSFLFTALFSFVKSDVVVFKTIETAAWTTFLQSSLVLGIFSSFQDKSKVSEKYSGNISKTMFLAFAFGSIGSFFGGFVGKVVAKPLYSNSFFEPSLIPCCACLVASYIGGSANFFEVASLLQQKWSSLADVVSIVAAVDIGLPSILMLH